LFFHSSCKKKNITYYIPQQFKDYGIYNEGSYWVYKNETTGMVDSSYMNFTPHSYYVHNGGYDTDPLYETVRCEVGGNFITFIVMDPDEYSLDFVSFGSTVMMSEGFQAGFISKSYGEIFKTISTNDSLEINGTNFYHVLNTQDKEFNNHGDTAIYTYYFVKFIGLIKCSKNVNNIDTTWSLLRYHIVH
jgi:hypothetical protein